MKLYDRSHLLDTQTHKLYWTNDIPLKKGKNGVAVIVPSEPKETVIDRATKEINACVLEYVLSGEGLPVGKRYCEDCGNIVDDSDYVKHVLSHEKQNENTPTQ